MHETRLLRQFVENGGEAVFSELVEQYGALVYGVARRQTGDHELAKEIVQNVFAILARKASRLVSNHNLPGWLHRTAVLESANACRRERTRRTHMREFQENFVLQEQGRDSWKDALPIVDAAINDLSDRDRNVILLRFFEEKSFREIGQAIGRSEDAGRKRVGKALTTLCRMLRKRGVGLSTGCLGGLLSSLSTTPLPAGTVSLISAGACQASAGVAHSVLYLNTLQTMTQTKVALTTAAIFIVPIGIQLHQLKDQREEMADLREQLLDREQIAIARPNNAEGRAGQLPPGPANIDWAKIGDAEGLRECIQVLRALEYPEPIIRDIVSGAVDRLFAQRFAKLRKRPQPYKYWNPRSRTAPLGSWEELEQLLDLKRERRDLLVSLLGHDRLSDDKDLESSGHTSEQALSFLQQEKQELVRAVHDALRQIEDHARDASRGLLTTEEKESLSAWRMHMEEKLRLELSDEEWEQYELRMSPRAAQIQANLTYFDASEKEYEAIYHANRQFEERYPPGQSPSDDPGYLAEKRLAREEMEAEISNTLGEVRYAEYKIMNRGDYQFLATWVDRYAKPRELISEVIDLQDQAVARADQLKASGNAPREQLDVIKSEAESAIRTILGDETFDAYINEHGWWVNRIDTATQNLIRLD